MNTTPLATHPIGIFDSGIGGLTVAHAVVKALPQENIVYFGDTAHLPYGDKSTAAIQAYAIKITQMLLEQKCKLILIACNSATAAAFELVKEYIGVRALLVNVVDPVVHFLKTNYANKRIGLIGTRQTVNSNIFKHKIDDLNLNIQLTTHATNLLAQAIEEFGNHTMLDGLLNIYLSDSKLHHIDALVLACTHYPVIKQRIATYYKAAGLNKLDIIDSSETVAQVVVQKLKDNQLLNTTGRGHKQFFVSDYTESFRDNAKLFFNEDVNLEHYPLWD